MKFSKNHANAKRHPVAEFFAFENYSYSSSTYLAKNNSAYSKK